LLLNSLVLDNLGSSRVSVRCIPCDSLWCES
jgi:hypothetical protein